MKNMLTIALLWKMNQQINVRISIMYHTKDAARKQRKKYLFQVKDNQASPHFHHH